MHNNMLIRFCICRPANFLQDPLSERAGHDQHCGPHDGVVSSNDLEEAFQAESITKVGEARCMT